MGAERSETASRTAARRVSEAKQSHQPMNKNLIGGRRNGTSWHNTAKFLHSVPEVNEAVGWRRFQFLSGEISLASAGEKSAEVIVVAAKPGAERRSQ